MNSSESEIIVYVIMTWWNCDSAMQVGLLYIAYCDAKHASMPSTDTDKTTSKNVVYSAFKIHSWMEIIDIAQCGRCSLSSSLCCIGLYYRIFKSKYANVTLFFYSRKKIRLISKLYTTIMMRFMHSMLDPDALHDPTRSYCHIKPITVVVQQQLPKFFFPTAASLFFANSRAFGFGLYTLIFR